MPVNDQTTRRDAARDLFLPPERQSRSLVLAARALTERELSDGTCCAAVELVVQEAQTKLADASLDEAILAVQALAKALGLQHEALLGRGFRMRRLLAPRVRSKPDADADPGQPEEPRRAPISAQEMDYGQSVSQTER